MAEVKMNVGKNNRTGSLSDSDIQEEILYERISSSETENADLIRMHEVEDKRNTGDEQRKPQSLAANTTAIPTQRKKDMYQDGQKREESNANEDNKHKTLKERTDYDVQNTKKDVENNIHVTNNDSLKEATVLASGLQGLKTYVSYWDCGGDDEYHATHHIHLSSDAVYILAFNMTSMIDDDGMI